LSFPFLCWILLQNVSGVLPKRCLAKKDPAEARSCSLDLYDIFASPFNMLSCRFLDLRQCFFPAELIKSISTPTFIVNSEYDSWQVR
jgi:O-palmitoleoyl-L-serine hydrolase